MVLADYFKLRILLNRTNLIRDEKTEVEFRVLIKGASDGSLMATLIGVSDPKYIELCKIGSRGSWVPAGYSGLGYLEDFCVSFLRKGTQVGSSGKEFQEILVKLKKELQSLGISRE